MYLHRPLSNKPAPATVIVHLIKLISPAARDVVAERGVLWQDLQSGRRRMSLSRQTLQLHDPLSQPALQGRKSRQNKLGVLLLRRLKSLSSLLPPDAIGLVWAMCLARQTQPLQRTWAGILQRAGVSRSKGQLTLIYMCRYLKRTIAATFGAQLPATSALVSL